MTKPFTPKERRLLKQFIEAMNQMVVAFEQMRESQNQPTLKQVRMLNGYAGKQKAALTELEVEMQK